MAELKFTKGTDTEHEITLDSAIVSVRWRGGLAVAGASVGFEVRTVFVGNGAPVEIKVADEDGSRITKARGKIVSNVCVGEVDIPEEATGARIHFEARLPKHGLSQESEAIPVNPPVRATNMKWSASEARRGDVLTLSADVSGIPDGAECVVTIYEYDEDGIHDRITALPAVVSDGRIELTWEYEYHEDTDEILTEDELQRYGGHYNPPEYFFTITYTGVECGKNQESGLLRFKDYIEIELLTEDGEPIPDEDYVLYLPDGSKREGKLDASGRAVERDVPPGRCRVEFPNM